MQNLNIEIWERNSFEVEAVRVTSQNLGSVALWTDGEICRQQTHNGRWYVLVDTVEYNRLKQTKVFVGDWIIRVQGQFKHYRNDSLRLAYHKKVNREALMRELIEQLLCVEVTPSHADYEDIVKGFTEQVMEIIEGREKQ